MIITSDPVEQTSSWTNVFDIVRRSKEISDKTGAAPGKLATLDYITNSYTSELHRALSGNMYYFGDAKYLKFGEELHKRYLEPHRPHERLTLPEEVNLRRMLDILREDEELEEYRAGATIEMTYVNNVWQMDQQVKIKVDMGRKDYVRKIRRNWKSAKDLKTTSARTFSEFMASTVKFKYWKQAALYMAVEGLDDFEFIAPSKHTDDVFKVRASDYPHYLKQGELQAKFLIQIHQSLKAYVNFATAYLGTY